MYTEQPPVPDAKAASPLDIEELFNLYGNDILRVCTVYLGKRSLAEDAFQDVFVKVVQKADTYRNDTPVKFWLLAIARNVCRDYLRSSWLTKVVSFDAWKESKGSEPDPSLPRKVADNGREEDRVIARLGNDSSPLLTAVCSLPAKYKDVILLRFYYDLSNEEIAAQLKISEGAVRTRMFRARKTLDPFFEGE
jgi:RNA polymerase sigma-70 factor (ECF subfamily)